MNTSETIHRLFEAYLSNRKDIVAAMLADDFTFSSPRDDHIDKNAYFERCWPETPAFRRIEIERLFADGNEVVTGYRAEKIEGGAFRNLELFRFRDGKIAAIEVYFGRDA